MADEEEQQSPPPSPSKNLFEGLHMSSGVGRPALKSPSQEETPKLSNRSISDNIGGATAGSMPLAPTLEEEEEETIQAPVTDKLLGLLESPSSRRPVVETEEERRVPSPPAAAAVIEDESAPKGEEEATDEAENPEEAEETETPTIEQPIDPEKAPPAAASGWFGGWFGSSAAPAPSQEEEEEPEPTASTEESHERDQKPAAVVEATEESAESEEAVVPPTESPSGAAASPNDQEEETPQASPKKELNEADRKAIDEAFHHDTKTARHKHRGLGETVTKVPNADVALRLLRKFAYKTRPKIVTTYGGAKSRSIFSFLFGSGKEDPTFVAYRDLMDILFEEGEDRDFKDDSDRLVDSVMGESGDSAARAKLAMAAFVYLFSMWGHASSMYLDENVKKNQEAFSELLAASLDAAAELVAHGCLDDVKIVIGEGPAAETHRAVHMLAQSVFNSDLTIERNELAAMKFLLTTGCRVSTSGDALLRGTHLLQTIRILYHIYLTTESIPNKTTARAALQQLVTSVFTRVVQTDIEERFQRTQDNFPSEDHRDAFLVLRAVCKLSMRSLPDPKTGMHSHVGLQSSGSNDTWDGYRHENSMGKGMPDSSERSQHAEEYRERPHLVYTAAIHPALESKLLALELLNYVLQKIRFSRGFIQRSGSQFHVAIRNYLCVSLLKNCTSDDTRVVNLSLLIFVPLVRNFRSILKNEIEAFVTNVFFVILESKNSPSEHKSIVVKTFSEICSDPSTLAEIFLNYDCDLSAQDLFHRIVNLLSKVSRSGLQEPSQSRTGIFGGASAARMEKFRNENRELRLDAMKALRQVLASLHASIVEPMKPRDLTAQLAAVASMKSAESAADEGESTIDQKDSDLSGKQSLVEIYDSKKRRKAEEKEIVLRFNQKPSAGIAYATKCGHLNGDDEEDVARYLLNNKDILEKTMIGEYLGREAEYQNGFSLRVLHEYVRLMDFTGLVFDEAIRFFLSGFRLPGEAQKIDRIMEKFAERFTEQNPDVFPTADAAFILAFSVIMLNTDLHNPAIKEERRMTKDGFIRNNRGICDGQDLPEELLSAIFDRIQSNPISLKEDDEARERVGKGAAASTGLPAALSPASFFTSHYDEMDRARENNFMKEREHIVRTTESILKRRRVSQHETPGKQGAKTKTGKSPKMPAKFVMTEDSGLRDEYVSPMFEVTWGPALAAFSTAMESANGTVGALISIASDEELELAVENAAETIEVCLTGFRFAIGTAGLCGNDVARDAYMLALSRFSQLGTGALLEPRHIRCIQTMMSLAREDGELLGKSWQHVFKALSEINRFHQLFHLMARNDRAAAAAEQRRRRRIEARERKRAEKLRRKAALEDGDSVSPEDAEDYTSESDDSLAESDLFSDDDLFTLEEDMDARAIDQANARVVYDAVSETVIEGIYERSSSFSAQAIKEFVAQLCLVSRNEISVKGDDKDLTHVQIRQQHALLSNSTGSSGTGGDQFHHSQPNIYNLQKLVEVMHYNMESRPRLLFAELWTVAAEHLTVTALHSNPAIAMYAVDSLRQLSIQYLEKDELEVFEFQRRFLKPLEVVMSKSAQTSTKELLLNCVDRIIHVFRADGGAASNRQKAVSRKGGLRSGWVPVLVILGLGGRDGNVDIAKMSFNILAGELRRCLDDRSESAGVLLSEHFVETVNTLMMFVGGRHLDISIDAIDQLQLLTLYLADSDMPSPQVKRKSTMASNGSIDVDGDGTAELELWWPILLGLSQTVGDRRPHVRSKALDVLIKIVVSFFFPPVEDSLRMKKVKLKTDIQTLQLIFRGVLSPIVEFAELQSPDASVPSLPSDFERFLSLPKQPPKKPEEDAEKPTPTGWLETTFDHFLDQCVMLCLRSIKIFKDDALIDEVFAILNACLLSDSGLLAVKGLHRLEQFVTSDLDSACLTDDVWATVSHMLRRCLAVRDLPRAPNGDDGQKENDEGVDNDGSYEESVREFIAEEEMLLDRRYIGSNAVMVIGELLTCERFSIDMRWRLFLVAGLGHAIVDWERAASILTERKVNAKTDDGATLPPDYFETALYGRKWLNRFLLQLAAMKEVAQAPSDVDPKTNRFVLAQNLLKDETQRLLESFLKFEHAASQYRHTELEESVHARLKSLVSELLVGYNTMSDDHLVDMSWMNSVLLSTCIRSKNEEIRVAVQKLVQRTAPAPQPYPAPIKETPSEEMAPAEEPTKEDPATGADDHAPVADQVAVETSASASVDEETESNQGTAEAKDNSTSVKPKEAEAHQQRSSSSSWNPMSWFGSQELEKEEEDGDSAKEPTSAREEPEEDSEGSDDETGVATEEAAEAEEAEPEGTPDETPTMNDVGAEIPEESNETVSNNENSPAFDDADESPTDEDGPTASSNSSDFVSAVDDDQPDSALIEDEFQAESATAKEAVVID